MKYYCDNFRHLVCIPYSVNNLHRMAGKLGIKRCWFHRGKLAHYDIPKRMVNIIKEQCEVVSRRKILEIIKSGQS